MTDAAPVSVSGADRAHVWHPFTQEATAPPFAEDVAGDVVAGEDANLVVFDPRQRWTARAGDLQSRSRNTPYDGREMLGRATTLFAKGRLVLTEGSLQ